MRSCCCWSDLRDKTLRRRGVLEESLHFIWLILVAVVAFSGELKSPAVEIIIDSLNEPHLVVVCSVRYSRSLLSASVTVSGPHANHGSHVYLDRIAVTAPTRRARGERQSDIGRHSAARLTSQRRRSWRAKGMANVVERKLWRTESSDPIAQAADWRCIVSLRPQTADLAWFSRTIPELIHSGPLTSIIAQYIYSS